MAREPADRYPTAAALAEDLLRFLEDRPMRARRASLPERAWKWRRRNPVLAAVGGLAVAALLATVALSLGVAYQQCRRPTPPPRPPTASSEQQADTLAALRQV